MAEPGLGYDNADRDQVRDAERKRVNPAPVPQVSCKHRDQTANDEDHNCQVEQEHSVGQQAVGLQVLHVCRLVSRFRARRDTADKVEYRFSARLLDPQANGHLTRR